MGNEDSIPLSDSSGHSSLPAFTKIVAQSVTTKSDYELLIVIRGQRNTGKTSLIQRMQGLPFANEYTPTKTLSAAEFTWTSFKGEKVRITLWDVVERALLPTDLDEKIEYPDATTVDTFKRADGVIIMIDTRFPDTLKLAAEILNKAPSHLPIVVFSNFQDTDEVSPIIPKQIKPFMDRFTFIAGSMKSNLGLTDLSKWLSLPLAKSKANLYLNKYNSLMETLNQKILDFTTSAEYYVDIETARERMPKPALIGHSQQNTQQKQHNQKDQGNVQAQKRPSDLNSTNDDNDFWSDDDEAEINNRIQQKIDKKKLISSEKNFDDLFVSNPAVKRRVIKKPQDSNQLNEPVDDNTKQTNEQKQEQPKKQSIPQIDSGDVDDDFFNDDDEDNEEPKVPQNVNLKVLDEDDDEPLRPNPLVSSKTAPRRQVQPKKQSEETKTTEKVQNEAKQEVKKPEKKAEPAIPTIKVDDEAENDGFFDDDDENEDENEGDANKTELGNDDSDEEELKPNPLVSAKPVPNTRRAQPAAAAQRAKETEQEEAGKEEKMAIAAINVGDEAGNNENDGFFDDDDENEDENEGDANKAELGKEGSDEEELKPNPLVSAKPVPNTRPAAKEAEREKEGKGEEQEAQADREAAEGVQQGVALPTVDAGEVDDDFFNDDENDNEAPQADAHEEEAKQAQQHEAENKGEAEEEAPQQETGNKGEAEAADQAQQEETEVEHKNEAEEEVTQEETEHKNDAEAAPQAQQQETEAEHKSEAEEEAPQAQQQQEAPREEKQQNPSANDGDALPEKVDDGFFDDEDDEEGGNEDAAGDNDDDDDDDEPVRPNPLVVATRVKSKLQESLAKQEKELQQQPEPEPEAAAPSVPSAAASQEVDDFFNDEEDGDQDEGHNEGGDYETI